MCPLPTPLCFLKECVPGIKWVWILFPFHQLHIYRIRFLQHLSHVFHSHNSPSPSWVLLKFPVLSWLPGNLPFMEETWETSLEARGSPNTEMRRPYSGGVNFVVYTTQFHSFKRRLIFFPDGVEALALAVSLLELRRTAAFICSLLVKTPVFSLLLPRHPVLCLVWYQNLPRVSRKVASSELPVLSWCDL